MVDAVHAERCAVCDCEAIFSAINEVGEDISGIVVSSYTLKSPPNCRQGGEEAEKSGVCGIAL